MPLDNQLNSVGILGRLQNLSQKISQIIVGHSVDDLISAERSIKRLRNVTNLKDSGKLSDLMNAIKSNSGNRSGTDVYSDVLKDMGLTQISGVEQDRIARYKEYAAIEAKIPYAKRALKVITQNILTPDVNSKTALISRTIDESNTNDIKHKTALDTIQNIIKEYKLETYISDIVYNTLKYGDYFVEIVNTNDVLKKYKLLSESTIKTENSEIIDTKLNFTLLYNATTNKSNFATREEYEPTETKKQKSDIFLNYLSPSTVVRLGDKFCFGYLVFPFELNKLTDVKNSMDTYNPQIQAIVDKILSRVKQLNRNDNAFDIFKSEENDLRTIIARLLIQTTQKDITARYVPTDLMVHYTTSRVNNPPYGTSVLYGSEFLARIIIAIESSIMVQRLTRSVERRVFKIELGATRDSEKYISEFRNTMQRRKFSVDSIGTIDSVPSQLATFEDMYIPMRNGKTLVEYDMIPAQGEISSRVDDLKMLRDSFIANLDVPAANLGVEENIDSKSTLSQQNAVFATSILNYQKEFTEYNTELLQKINAAKYGDEYINNFQLTFNPPMTLFAEKQADYFEMVGRIIDSGEKAGVPAKTIANKFLSTIDWANIQDEQISGKLESEVTGETNDESTKGGTF